MNLQFPYYVDGEGFDEYEDAVFYSEVLLAQFGVYHVVYCRHEIEAHLQEVLE